MAEPPVFFTRIEEDYAKFLLDQANEDGPQGNLTYQRDAAHICLKNAAFAAKAMIAQPSDYDLWLSALDEWNARAERHLRLLKLLKL